LILKRLCRLICLLHRYKVGCQEEKLLNFVSKINLHGFNHDCLFLVQYSSRITLLGKLFEIVEALSQISLVKDCIATHRGSSLTLIFRAAVALAKGIEILVHKMIVLIAEVRTLRTANEALSKRRRAIKNSGPASRILTIKKGSDILARTDAVKEIEANKRVEKGVLNAGLQGTHCCGSCKKTGHNARTCQEDV